MNVRMFEIAKPPAGDWPRLALVALAALSLAVPAFAEDPYIESDGTQYVNTGYCIGPKTKIELDFQLTTTNRSDVAQKRLFGMMGGTGELYGVSLPLCDCYIGDKNIVSEDETATNTIKVFSFIYSTTGAVENVAQQLFFQGENFQTCPVDTNRHTITVDFAADAPYFQFTTDGAVVTNFTLKLPLSDATSPYPLSFFGKCGTTTGVYASNTNGFGYTEAFRELYHSGCWSYNYPVKMRVYAFRIWERGDGEDYTLRRNFTPCVKGGVAGFKETVSGYFYQGENTRSCKAGGDDVPTEKDDPYIWSPNNVLGSSAENNIFLETGYCVKPETRLELDYAMMTPDWTIENHASWLNKEPWVVTALGSGAADDPKYFYLNTNTNGFMHFKLGREGESAVASQDPRGVTAKIGIDKAYNVRRTVSMSTNEVCIITCGYTNATYKIRSTHAITDTLGSITLKIGTNYRGDGRYLPMKIYGLRIYESGVLVTNYLPSVTNGVGCLTNSLVSTEVLTSRTQITTSAADKYSDGSATNVLFDAGGDIACSDGSDEAYLEFDGVTGHAIDTGCCVGTNSCIEIDYQIWNSKPNGWQYILHQNDEDGMSGIYAVANIKSTGNNSNKLFYAYCDRIHGTSHDRNTHVVVNNFRTQLTLDSYGNHVKVVNNGIEKLSREMNFDYNYSRTSTVCNANLWVGGNCGGTSHGSCLRLYSLKISEAGVLKRCFVPYKDGDEVGLFEMIMKRKFPLVGGKVSGKTFKGEAFQFAPCPAGIAVGQCTLKCVAAGAQSYIWYHGDDVIGETGDTIECNDSWAGGVYSVRPVYTVFNERVVGDKVTVRRLGLTTTIRGGE